MLVQRVDSRHVDRLGGQETGNEVDVSRCIAGRWEIEGELRDNVIYGYLDWVCQQQGLPKDLPNTSAGSLSRGASPGPNSFLTTVGCGCWVLGRLKSHPDSSDIPVLRAV